MVTTVAERLGITFDEAEELAAECAERNWLAHEVHTVALRQDGFAAAIRGLQATSAAPDRARPRRTKPSIAVGLLPRTARRARSL
jgi:hypothetical protein